MQDFIQHPELVNSKAIFDFYGKVCVRIMNYFLQFTAIRVILVNIYRIHQQFQHALTCIIFVILDEQMRA